jgi:hypothetical protein
MTQQPDVDVYAELLARTRRADGAQLAALSIESAQAHWRDELTVEQLGELQVAWTLRLNQLVAPRPTGIIEFPDDLSQERAEELRAAFMAAQHSEEFRLMEVQSPKWEVFVPVPRGAFDKLVVVARCVSRGRRALGRRRGGATYPRAEARLALDALQEAGLLAGDDDV